MRPASTKAFSSSSSHRLALAALAISCGAAGTASKSGAGDGASSSDAGGVSGDGGTSVSLTVGSRPFSLYLPSAYDGAAALPLVIFLHHLGGAGSDGEDTFGLQTLGEARGYLYIAPEGTSSPMGQFWNATDACCAQPGESPDDSGYLADIIALASANYRVDIQRVFVLGHSNGGFMAHRMACDHADIIAAAASISGAMWEDASKCQPSTAISVLEIHATADPVISYTGGLFNGVAYPSAATTVGDWAGFNQCNSSAIAGSSLSLSGSSTSTESFAACSTGVGVGLWSVDIDQHSPFSGSAATSQVLDWLFAHPKP